MPQPTGRTQAAHPFAAGQAVVLFIDVLRCGPGRQVGGELLTIEAVAIPGKGKTIMTGSLGDIMQESIQAALTVVRSRAASLGIDENFQEHKDLHVHVPEGATPKDGPSAGACITSVIYSLLNDKPIRNTLALTGEINLQGGITMIGGLQLKIMGAIKAGVTELLYPAENQKDFNKMGQKYETQMKGVSFHQVKTIQDVFAVLFSSDSV